MPLEYLNDNEYKILLTDGGLETTLVFDLDINLPHFAAFDLLNKPLQLEQIRSYYRQYLNLAAKNQVGFLLDTVTWRANPDWIFKLGYGRSDVLRVNLQATRFAISLKQEFERKVEPLLINGCVGPRHDGYLVGQKLTVAEAHDYHLEQILALVHGGVDLVTAMTINYRQEAQGIVTAAAVAAIPVVISFTLETDGRLPDGESLKDAIEHIDRLTDSYPLYYMINCAHPTHFMDIFQEAGDWKKRIRGVRANASCKSHAELNESEELDRGDKHELSARYLELKQTLPQLMVFGGCCGTDIGHISEILKSLSPQKAAL